MLAFPRSCDGDYDEAIVIGGGPTGFMIVVSYSPPLSLLLRLHILYNVVQVKMRHNINHLCWVGTCLMYPSMCMLIFPSPELCM